MSAQISRVLGDRRFYRFVLVGGTCFAANLFVLFIGTEVAGMHYLVSMLISIIVVNILGWALNRSWTFQTSRSFIAPELTRFTTASFLSCFIAMGLMAVLVSGLGIHYLLSSTIIAIGLTLANFVVHRDWSFRAPSE